MVLAFVRDVTEHYWRKYYKRKEGAPDAGPVVHGVSFFSLTWQRRAGDFVFIGYDQKATVATKGLIKNFMGKTVRRIYGYRTDLLDDFERCYREKALIRRKTLYRMFTTGGERIVEITYVFVPPDIVVMYIEDHTDRDAAEAFNQSLVRSAPVGVCVVQDGRLRFVNPRFLDYTGCAETELIGELPTDFIHPDDMCLLQEILQCTEQGDPPARSPYRIRIGGKAGLRWTMVTAASIFYRYRQAVLLNFLDHTELEQAREKLDEMASCSRPSWKPFPMRSSVWTTGGSCLPTTPFSLSSVGSRKSSSAGACVFSSTTKENMKRRGRDSIPH